MIPDYGFRLLSDGFNRETQISLPNFSFYNISVVAIDSFTSMAEMPYNGIVHALSLDFGISILNALLDKADDNAKEYITAELREDPLSTRTFDLVNPIVATVSARLGSLFRNNNETYVPLIILDVV